MNLDLLQQHYGPLALRAERLRVTVVEQISKLFKDNSITLGVPIESRVKEWSSIEEKLSRKGLQINELQEITDFVGVRTIILFRSDLERAEALLCKAFEEVHSEDMSALLGDSQFGYQSRHLTAKIPKSWCAVPSMADLGDLQIEIQLRTLAQHIWAAASHKLQYKQESNVPPPLRRTINRISAILEIVDLEFDRVLIERQSYKDLEIPVLAAEEKLNVDIVASLLSEVFDAKSLSPDEAYGEFLDDVSALGIATVEQLKGILRNHKDLAEAESKRLVEKFKNRPLLPAEEKERLARGVFLSHVGLGRSALRAEFGDRLEAVMTARRIRRTRETIDRLKSARPKRRRPSRT